MKILLGLFVVFALLTGSVFSQTITVTIDDGKKVILKPDKTWEYLEEKQTQSIGKLTIPAQPDSVEKLAIFVNTKLKDKLEKSEFETEAEYVSRIKKLVSETQFEGKPLKETFIILPALPKYDAETQSFGFDWFYLAGLDFPVSKENKDNLSFAPSVRLLFVNQKSLARAIDLSRSIRPIKMPPKQAAENKANFKIAVVGFPLQYEFGRLNFVAQRAIVFNDKTNEIYGETIFDAEPKVGSFVRIVKARRGDTVAIIAAREGVSAIEVAKFNGLLPDSELPEGREIRIPTR